MKRTLQIILMCLTIHVQFGWGQNTIASIRQRYADMKEYIKSHNGDNENDGAEWMECYHVEARHFLPATGGHKENVYMYFGEKENPNDEVYASHFLKFVTTKYNYSVREFYEEYLYDTDGNIAFIYAKHPYLSFGENDEDMDYEFRFYFSKGKLIHTIVKKSTPEKGDYKEEYSGSTVKKIHQETYQDFLNKSREFMKMFNAVDHALYNF